MRMNFVNYSVKIGKEINTKDIDEILDLIGWGRYEPEQWINVKEKSTFMVSVLSAEKTIGFARVIDDTCMAMIYDVAVHPAHQKKGVGTLLMNEILKYINANRFVYVNLFYDMNNKGLDNFYRKFGFELMPNGMRLKKKE
ncbi:MAG: GNAT family N-acetyltransferase [Alphaproteobacteria bacterium]|nr:GNAT family N-acetyltransferase [Alphaproteobacteria bacterium]